MFEVFVNKKVLRFFPVVKKAEIFYLLLMVDPVGAENNHKVWIKFKLKQCWAIPPEEIVKTFKSRST